MRVALLTTSAFHPSLGGAEELTRCLATSLIEAGHEVQVWTSQPPDDDVPGREAVDSIEVLRFTFPLPRANLVAAVKWPVPALAVLRDLRIAARSFSPGVLHVQCFSGNGVYAAALSRLMGIPLVISLQGGQSETTRTSSHAAAPSSQVCDGASSRPAPSLRVRSSRSTTRSLASAPSRPRVG